MQNIVIEKIAAKSPQVVAQAARAAVKRFFGTVRGMQQASGTAAPRASVGRLGVALADVAKYPQSQAAVRPVLQKAFGPQRSAELMRQYGFTSAIGAPQAGRTIQTAQQALKGVNPETGGWIGRTVQKPDSVLAPIRERLRSAGELSARGQHVGQL